MRGQKGGILVYMIIFIIAVVLIVGGMFLVKRLGLNSPKNPNNTVPVQVEETIDLSKKPSDPKYVPDFAMHCNNTPSYHWDGSNCVRN